ncbi:MAG: M20 metallopeptidase family protein [Sphaerochaetaceae bacterium]|jgi:amidohydrolase
MEIKKEILSFEDQLINLRREFHKIPELGFEEFKTQQKIIEYLESINLKPQKCAKTGVVVTIEGASKGKVVALRADIDALQVKEETNLPFSSTHENLMHACGHDGHIAISLIAAKYFALNKDKFNGTVKIIFQPNEENAGAYLMIEQGVLENPKVDAIFALHLWAELDSGFIDIVDGPQMAGAYDFTIEVKGSGGHAGFPYKAIDPIMAATSIIQNVQVIQTREKDALNPAIVMFTKLESGTSQNIISDKAILRGTIRYLYEDAKPLIDSFKRVVTKISEAHRTKVDIELTLGNNLLSNDPKMASLMRSSAVKTLGDSSLVQQNIRTMAGEDFSEFLREVPGSFAFVGARSEKAKSTYPHHHSKFTIDEGVLKIGSELLVRSALDFLKSH